MNVGRARESFAPIGPKAAPVRSFLKRFGGSADPLKPMADTRVFETYPVLAMIALGWTRPDSRATGRLPKYNPKRKKTFSLLDWQYVCGRASAAFRERGLDEIGVWIDGTAQNKSPRKSDQDGLGEGPPRTRELCRELQRSF